ncbi:MAG: hypothetical protein ABIA04_02890 [Pseudomonadota bacterium]
MKNKKTIYTIAAVLLSAFAIFFRTIISSQKMLALIDVIFLFGLFTRWTDSDKKRKYYKIIFVIFALVSLFNEGILKNEGGGNWGNFGLDLLVKILSGIVIFSYMSYIKNASKK